MNVGAMDMGSTVSGTPGAVGVQRQNPAHPVQGVGEDPANNDEQIRQQVAEMQSQLSRMNVSLAYTTYGDHGEKIAVIVADKETGEVIREIPSREIRDLYAKMNELSGMIFNREI